MLSRRTDTWRKSSIANSASTARLTASPPDSPRSASLKMASTETGLTRLRPAVSTRTLPGPVGEDSAVRRAVNSAYLSGLTDNGESRSAASRVPRSPISMVVQARAKSAALNPPSSGVIRMSSGPS